MDEECVNELYPPEEFELKEGENVMDVCGALEVKGRSDASV